ncbi:MAG TPA: small, acid-soluble spore protein, alpha/beta type [Thermoanaerobacterales bacterium]|nr:small, acid-soluble spore protein, alpha/beta type [Thermoanaerobacterales bacterium]
MEKNSNDKTNEVLKYEIAKELDLLDKIEKVGWSGLSAEETGKIGGIISKRKRRSRE